MASKETWAKLRHFRPDSTTDKWGEPDAINDALLLHLDDFRNFLGVPFYVTSGVRVDDPSKPSYHSRRKGACAVDVVIPQYEGHPIDLILAAMRFGFTGIGWYPHWEWNGIKCGGLHLDMRPLGQDPDGTENYGHSQWMAIKVKNSQRYIPLTYANIVRNLGGPT